MIDGATRVLIDGAVLRGTTGVARYIGGLLEASAPLAATAGVKLEVLLPEVGVRDVLDERAQRLEALGVRVRRPGRIASLALMGALRAGAPLPVDEIGRPDVCVFTRYTPATTRRARRASFVYDLAAHVVPECVEAGYADRLRRHTERAVLTSHRVLAISETIADEVRQRWPSAGSQIDVIPPGAPPAIPMNRGDVARRLERAAVRHGFILFVGTVEPRKNVGALLSAHLALPDTIRSAHPLVIAGRPGWERAEVLDAIRSAPNVVWLEDVGDDLLAALYLGAALFVFPTRYEGFGIPVLEALCAGCPVVCSDIPVLRELAADAAAYVKWDDTRAMTAVMATLLTDGRRRAALASVGTIQAKRYDWASSATAFLRVLRELGG